MKPRCSNQRNPALTITEVLVIIIMLALLVAALLPALVQNHDTYGVGKFGHNRRAPCVENMHQISLAFRVWAGDHNDKYPMQVSVTNWGAMELAVTGDVARIFCVMSNELSTPKYLFCPADTKHTAATSFSASLSDTNISYFVSLDADKKYPQMLFVGDDNLVVNGKPVQPGILNLATNNSVEWTMKRHNGNGNVVLADGSVQQLNSETLRQVLEGSVFTTNRLAIP